MKKRWGMRVVMLSAVFMTGAVLNGCMSSVIQDVAMDLYGDRVQGDPSDRTGADEDDDADPADNLEDGQMNSPEDGADGEGPAGEDPGGAGEGAAGGDTSKEESYGRYIKEELEPKYGKGDNTSFSYGYEEISYTDTDYWFASPMTARLEDGIVATCQRDLDKDGFDELLLLYIEGSKGSGNGRNSLGLKVYSEKNGAVVEMGGFRIEDCFSGYNREEQMIGLKDLGDKRLIYVEQGRGIYTWADGEYPNIRLYQYDGSSLKEIYNVSAEGSDGTWWQDWGRDLHAFGFTLPSGSRWGDIGLNGEPGFEVLAYGEGVTNEPQSGQYTDLQRWMLDNGRIEGGIYGPGSDIVKRLNQGMTSYTGGGYAGSSNGYSRAEDYILPQSSTRYLTRQDLAGLTKDQLRLARNEIYARHGRKFQTQEIQDYFNSKSWYTGTIEPKDFREEYLNVYEKENLKLIQSLED